MHLQLTDTQFWALHSALIVARDRYKDNASEFRKLPGMQPMVEQFQDQASEVGDLMEILMDAYDKEEA